MKTQSFRTDITHTNININFDQLNDENIKTITNNIPNDINIYDFYNSSENINTNQNNNDINNNTSGQYDNTFSNCINIGNNNNFIYNNKDDKNFNDTGSSIDDTVDNDNTSNNYYNFYNESNKYNLNINNYNIHTINNNVNNYNFIYHYNQNKIVNFNDQSNNPTDIDIEFFDNEYECINQLDSNFHIDSYDDYMYKNSYKEASLFCLEESIDILDQCHPINLYYKRYRTKYYENVATIKFFLNKQKTEITYKLQYVQNNYINENEDIGKIYASLTSLVHYIRTKETNKKIKLNGWVVLRYKNREGKYKSLNELVTPESRNGQTIITRNSIIFEKDKKYFIPKLLYHLLPQIEDKKQNQ